MKPDNFVGRIECKKVCFSYPTRPSEKVFDNLDLTIEPGNKIGFVGESGCGKSSLIQLLLRLYDI